MELKALLVLLIGGVVAWVSKSLMRAGASSERKKGAVAAEQAEGRVADAEAMVEHSKPVAGRLSSLRERINKRRGVE